MPSIFISGAAQGIGASVAELFYQQGYHVGIYDLQLEKAQQLAERLGERAQAGILDVTQYSSWQTALDGFTQWAGQLNILVNNAGILYSGPFADTDIKAHQRTIDVNVMGVLNGCHAALPWLKQAKYARVINLSSASAIYGQPDLLSYSASKFAVRGITEGLDLEWREHGIRVFDVMPLFVQTAMVKDMQASSIQHLGVHLQSQDVAKQIYQLATKSTHPLSTVHQPVGLQSRLFYQLAKITPDGINRLSNLWMSRH